MHPPLPSPWFIKGPPGPPWQAKMDENRFRKFFLENIGKYKSCTFNITIRSCKKYINEAVFFARFFVVESFAPIFRCAVYYKRPLMTHPSLSFFYVSLPKEANVNCDDYHWIYYLYTHHKHVSGLQQCIYSLSNKKYKARHGVITK